MEKYRIENVEKARLNGRNVKLFQLFELFVCHENENNFVYMYKGSYDVPVRTANKNIIEYLQHNNWI